jgi:hypothetical protein
MFEILQDKTKYCVLHSTKLYTSGNILFLNGKFISNEKDGEELQ